jgi:hypothetical protein
MCVCVFWCAIASQPQDNEKYREREREKKDIKKKSEIGFGSNLFIGCAAITMCINLRPNRPESVDKGSKS